MKYFKYLAARLSEASTYASIAAVVASASALVGPAKYVAVLAGVIGVLVPS